MANKSSDELALEKLIDLYQSFHYTKQVSLIDKNFKILYISEPLFNILKIGEVLENIIGMTVTEAMQAVKRPDAIIQQTQQVLNEVVNNSCIVESIGINLKRDFDHVILHFKNTPLYNRATGNIIALETEVATLKFPVLLSSPNKLFKPKTGLSLSKSDELLTNRQHEVLFLQFHCKSAKEIAQKLSQIYSKPISLHTIGKINQQLYQKFHVYNLETLLEQAYLKGYNRKIPISLLSDHSIKITEL